jgi:hypothetical protein
LEVTPKAPLDTIRKELSRDVSAFANSDGGILIYGVQEDKTTRHPTYIDNGVPTDKINKEWLENSLGGNVSPRIEGLRIIPIPLTDTHSLFVLEIPKSPRAPHQAGDNRYYKRFNFSNHPMEDYEVRDVYSRRAITPPLVHIDLEITQEELLNILITNLGNIPAEEVSFRVSPELGAWLQERERSILLKGTKRIPPGKRFLFSADTAFNILKGKSIFPASFKIDVSYRHPAINAMVSESFEFDVRDYEGTALVLTELSLLKRQIKDSAKLIADSLKTLTAAVRNLSKKSETSSSESPD